MGRGSNVDQVPHADPFTLIHYIESQTRLKPPFCAHPHLGAEICSILLKGEEIVPWDNISGSEKTKLLPGGMYYVSTGRGVVHDETQHLPFSTRNVSEAAFEPDLNGNVDSPEGQTTTQFFQVWWNGGYIYGDDIPPCTTQLIQPSAVPLVLVPSGLAVRVLIGTLPVQSWQQEPDEEQKQEQGGEQEQNKQDEQSDPEPKKKEGERSSNQSPVDQMNFTPMLILHCRIDPEGDSVISLPPEMNGLIFVTGKRSVISIGGGDDDASKSASEVVLSEENVSTQMALLPPGGCDLRVKNLKKEHADFMLFLGRPVRKPYCKYVGYGGAMVHASPELCEAAMAEYERDPMNFGLCDGKATPKEFSERFKLIPGFFNKNGPGLEREDGVLARFEYSDEFIANERR